MTPEESIPILYIYIFRNLNCDNSVITHHEAKVRMGRVIRRAPAVVYDEILNELCDYGLLRKLDKNGYRLLYTIEYKKQSKRLREYVFPINLSD